MSLWHQVGQQLKYPHGVWGCALGHAMRLANAKPNAAAIDALAIEPGDTILELGFGPGQAVACMAQYATSGKIYGIDASPTMLKQALRLNRRAVKEGRVVLQMGDFLPLQLASASVDKILAVNVVYFWRDAAAVIGECHRVLRHGGKLAIYATDASTMKRWKFANTGTHLHYTVNRLRDALQQGGFTEQELTITPMIIPPGVRGILAVAEKTHLES